MRVDLASGPRAAMVGQTVSHYRVLRVLGAGGMGDVYEAEDLNLGRLVALKFLSAERASSPQAVQRLEREARAASALNHPHICTIFDIGEHDGDRFIAMERMDGETLRNRLTHGALDARTLLRIAIEVADALEAAHRAHVVHRDVSPSNIFLTHDGHAKLLDFGLATYETHEDVGQAPPDESTMTAELVLTSPGAVIGTVAYMSPEQVRGDPVDHRTDLFSFGAVLYEMATGRRAFRGKTSALIFDAILHGVPAPLASLSPAVHPGLQAIVDKALEKDPHLRYQHAEDLRTDLERLKRDVEGAPSSGAAAPTRSAWRWIALLAGVAAVGIVIDLSWPVPDRIPDGAARPLTSAAGVQGEPAISPDGKLVAFTSDEGGNQDIWIVGVAGGPTRRLTTRKSTDRHPAWFPDGSALAFVSESEGGEHPNVWRAPLLDGDAATMLMADADSPVIAPDGSSIAFVRADAQGYTRIMVAQLSDPAQTRVLTTQSDGRWDHSDPTWSPDATQICYAAWDGLWIVPVTGGPARRLTSEESDFHPAWSPDGRHVYFFASLDSGGALWRVAVSGGRRERVTLGSGFELSPDVSRDGRLLAFASQTGDDDVVSIDLESGRETPFGTGRDDWYPALGPTATSVYFVANTWGFADIWKQRLDGPWPIGPPERLFEQGGVKTHPSASPDGKWLAYYRVVAKRRDVWIVPTGGGAPVQITTDGNSYHPTWSPDSAAILYVSERAGAEHLWTQRVVEGRPAGPAAVVADGWTRLHRFPAWSPDGSSIAFITAGASGTQEVGVVSSTGGQVHLETAGAQAARVRWNRQTGGLVASGLWGESQYQLRTRAPGGRWVGAAKVPILLGTTQNEAQFDLSPDARYIIASRSTHAGHVWIMEAKSRSF